MGAITVQELNLEEIRKQIDAADSVQKSYPAFWQDYLKAGGKIEVLE